MATDIVACDCATSWTKFMIPLLQALWPREKGLERSLTKLQGKFYALFDTQRQDNHKYAHRATSEHLGFHFSPNTSAMDSHVNRAHPQYHGQNTYYDWAHVK